MNCYYSCQSICYSKRAASYSRPTPPSTACGRYRELECYSCTRPRTSPAALCSNDLNSYSTCSSYSRSSSRQNKTKPEPLIPPFSLYSSVINIDKKNDKKKKNNKGSSSKKSGKIGAKVSPSGNIRGQSEDTSKPHDSDNVPSSDIDKSGAMAGGGAAAGGAAAGGATVGGAAAGGAAAGGAAAGGAGAGGAAAGGAGAGGAGAGGAAVGGAAAGGAADGGAVAGVAAAGGAAAGVAAGGAASAGPEDAQGDISKNEKLDTTNNPDSKLCPNCFQKSICTLNNNNNLNVVCNQARTSKVRYSCLCSTCGNPKPMGQEIPLNTQFGYKELNAMPEKFNGNANTDRIIRSVCKTCTTRKLLKESVMKTHTSTDINNTQLVGNQGMAVRCNRCISNNQHAAENTFFPGKMDSDDKCNSLTIKAISDVCSRINDLNTFINKNKHLFSYRMSDF